jgi:methionyl-tRNA synthetase
MEDAPGRLAWRRNAMDKHTSKILVTSGLLYANGPIHLGHLVEYIQADIWVRFQRLRGRDCIFVCGSDAHGTPIMLQAREEGISAEEMVVTYQQEHQRDLGRFMVEFDNFYTTHSEENRELVEEIYHRLTERNLIERRVIEQAYDEEAGMFLPDRFIRGTCPVCGAEDQYGDSCEVCGATYSPGEIRDPKSILSGAPPVLKESEHVFFRLGEFEAMLKNWTANGAVDTSVARKLDEWFDAGLRDWDISRDAPYFGFQIPDTEDKYFYVWLDAPVGYLASFKNLCDSRTDLHFEEYFEPGSQTELYHFIGKDIIYFHALFWPAVLEGANYRLPTAIFAHGFLTVNGQKMSKSRGTFISAAAYLEHLDPEYLRYYYAVKLGSGIEDIDLNLDDFVARTNSDLVGKLVNIASRCAGFISKNFDGRLSDQLENPALQEEFVNAAVSIEACYEHRQYSKAIREIMKLADRANQYIDERKPWVLARNEKTAAEVQNVCTQALNLFRVLMIYLKPVLPELAKKTEEFLGIDALSWADLAEPVLGRSIQPYRPMMLRVDDKAVSALVEALQEPA